MKKFIDIMAKACEAASGAWKRLIEKMEKYAPPGWDVEMELMFSGLMLIIFALAFGATFWVHMSEGVSLGLNSGNSRNECESMMWVMRNTLLFIIPALMVYGGYIKAHYRSFKKGSMAVYTMKRVPDALEIHRRCLALPLGFIMITLILAVLLAACGMHAYDAAVPSWAYVRESIPFSYWRMIICLY